MSQVTYCASIIGSVLNVRRLWPPAPLLALLVFAAVPSRAQAPTPQAQAGASLAQPLARAYKGETELHILYVHGMGIEVPKHNSHTQDFEVSQEFRTHFCHMINCTADELLGRQYAGEADFDPHKDPPPLMYFAHQVWTKSPNNDEWHAAAPFVDHYRLTLENRSVIYVDEINWWPLILSAKCREIVAPEASLVARDNTHIATCSAKTTDDLDHPERFKSFDWLPYDPQHDPAWPEPAVINRALKRGIMDWGFADALLAVGPLRQYLLEGIREVVLDCFHEGQNQEFVVLSHSLGSYLMLSAFDIQNDLPAQAEHAKWKAQFQTLLGETSHAYFMANQVRLLELASLDNSKDGNVISHLQVWSGARSSARQCPPQIVAWSDPGDLLTWEVPPLGNDARGLNGADVEISNRPAPNALRWFWLLENPVAAHTKYDQNKKVLRALVPKSYAHPSTKENPDKPQAPAASSCNP